MDNQASALLPYVTRIQTPYEEEVVRQCLQEFEQMVTWRNTFSSQWEEVASVLAPNSVNTFFYGAYNFPGQKKTYQQIDASGMLANHRFAAIMDSLLTPRNQKWHGLCSNDPDLMKDRQTKLWYEQVVNRLFKLRYAPIANFASQNNQNFEGLGAFGTAAMFVDQAYDEAGYPIRALRYRAIPLGELFIRENHQGLVDGFNRWFRLDARQCLLMFGPENFPEALRSALDQQSQQKFNFIQTVHPRHDYDAGKLNAKGKKFASYYISIEGRCLLSEGGYNTLPMAISRYVQAPGEVYGRSPAMMVLPALKTLNAQKATFLKQGHRAADPVLLTADDGILDMSLRPGALNKGGVSADGRALVQILPTGNIQINKEMMAEEKALINDMFLVSLFQIMTENPQMTATEVVERTNEKGILIAPTAGRQQSEYLGSMIHRELDVMAQLGLLPPITPAMKEARSGYEVEYTSPLARAMRAQDVAGFARTLEMVTNVAQATGDPSGFDVFALDRAYPAIADINGTPLDWMASDDEIKQKRMNRAKAQQQAAQVQALPAQAAMIKAQATVAKSQGTQPNAPGIPTAPGQPSPQAPPAGVPGQ